MSNTDTIVKTKEEILDEHGISKNEFWSPDAAMESMQEYADQEKRTEAIAFAEWMQRYTLYDYHKHPFKYCARQQPNRGRGTPETWTAEEIYNKFKQQ